ncbi:MAG: hypothetical protein DMF74_16030 [Acidobacteria bacterium]|nr:MAG: hypothetical protein DMF74_16030 [Acidobacteriota bacterium]
MENDLNEIGQLFMTRSRYHLSQDFLPKIERCVELLKDEQIWWRANPQSNSIGNLILHLSGNVRQWIVSGLGGAADSRDRGAEFAQRDVISREELIEKLKQTLGDADAALAKFDAEKLLDLQSIQGCDVSALEAILHVVEHFSMHTGQIILMTKMLAEADLAFYEFTGATPIPKWRNAPE